MSSVVGVDLGYQLSVIAAAGRGGVDVILNGNSNRLNPTMVGFDQSRKMGEHASSGVSGNYKNTVFGMKRLVGLAFNDPRAQKEMQRVPVTFVPFPREHGPDSIAVKVTLNGEEHTLPIEAILGMMVKHMGLIAAQKALADSTNPDSSTTLEQYFPQDWVIAIPSYFTDAQRRGVLEGCEIVGINGVQRLMHENTATALAYGIFKDLKKEFTKDSPTNVLFIDFGATAYTVSVVVYEPGKLIVKSAHCDADLGGRDFDWVIASWLAEQFEKKFAGKLSGKPMEKPKSRNKLLAAAEKAKKTLSPEGVKEAHVDLEMLLDELDFHVNIKASEYEALCEPLLARLAGPIQKALEEANLKASDLSSVEIVGGTTRIGCVKRKLQEILGCGLSTTMNADEAVARGAALQSAILSPRFKVLPYEIVEAQPYPIKISWQDDEQASGMEVDEHGVESPSDSVVMFNRGLNFPIVRRVTLRRQGYFAVHASYDESAMSYGLVKADPIAEFHIKSVPGVEHKVRVNVKMDSHGIIHLSSAQMVEEIEEEVEESGDPPAEGEAKAGEEDEKKKKKIKKTNLEFTVTRPLSFSKAEIAKVNEMDVAMANNDRVVKETADMRNALESYSYEMRDKLSSDNHLGLYGTTEEKGAFQDLNEKLDNWLYEEGFDATKAVYAEKLQALKKLGSPIERRQIEAQARSACVDSLKSTLEFYQKWVNDSQVDEKYAHITDEERETVRAMVDSVSAWMYDMLDKQGGLALHEDPALTVADLKAKNTEVTKTCSPIMNKPKPVPKKEPVVKKEDPPAAETPKEAEPMDGVEKESNGDEPAKMEVEG